MMVRPIGLWAAVTVVGVIGVYRFGTVTAYYVWAASGPPNPPPELWMARANVFAFVTLGFLVVMLTGLVMVIRAMLRARSG